MTSSHSSPSRAGGDARTALSVLELAAQTADGAPTESHVEDAARKRPLVYDRAGDRHYDFASAFIKSMRGSDPDAAVYYLAAMLEGGEDARFIARRMVILASEDIGNADPNALVVAVAAANAVEHVGLPEAQLNLAQAAIYLALAPKSNAVTTALAEARRDVREQGNVRPPKFLRSTGHPGQRKLGHGEGYVYPHDDPAGFDMSYLPERAEGQALLPTSPPRSGHRRVQRGRYNQSMEGRQPSTRSLLAIVWTAFVLMWAMAALIALSLTQVIACGGGGGSPDMRPGVAGRPLLRRRLTDYFTSGEGGGHGARLRLAAARARSRRRIRGLEVLQEADGRCSRRFFTAARLHVTLAFSLPT